MSNRSLIALAALLMAAMWLSAFRVFGQAGPEDIFFEYIVSYLQEAGIVDMEWEFRLGEGGDWGPIPSSEPVPVQAYETTLELPFADGEIRSRVPDQGDGRGPSEWVFEEVPEPSAGLSACLGSLLLGCLGRLRSLGPYRRSYGA